MVLGAWERRQHEEVQKVDRQFFRDNPDVARDALRGVAGKSEDIAGIGNCAVIAPRLQHFAIFSDLVLPLRSALQTLRVDGFEADVNLIASSARGLGDEIRNLVT